MGFEKGNKLGGRKKGSKNRISRDVREVFHRVYEDMGKNQLHDETGEPLTGHEAMLEWARNNPTEFYRLYGKMIPAKEAEDTDSHEDFIDGLIEGEDEIRLIEANVVDVGKEGHKQLPNGANTPQNSSDNAPCTKKEGDLV